MALLHETNFLCCKEGCKIGITQSNPGLRRGTVSPSEQIAHALLHHPDDEDCKPVALYHSSKVAVDKLSEAGGQVYHSRLYRSGYLAECEEANAKHRREFSNLPCIKESDEVIKFPPKGEHLLGLLDHVICCKVR